MAKPIKDTPILYGKDAEVFCLNMLSVPSEVEKKKELQRIEKSLEEFKTLLKELDIK